jgi:RHS repeat-associated protein
MDCGGAAARRVKHAMPCMLNQYAGATLEKTYTWGMDLSGTMQGAGGVGGLLAANEIQFVEVDGETVMQTTPYYPTFDGNGNVSEYLDDSGDVVAHYEYDPFGNLTTQSYAGGFDITSFAHKFSTKYHDTETGLYYYGYRYYDPVTGRWPSRDPIGERGGMNLYGFVGNDGVNKWDKLGLKCVKKRRITLFYVGFPKGAFNDVATGEWERTMTECFNRCNTCCTLDISFHYMEVAKCDDPQLGEGKEDRSYCVTNSPAYKGIGYADMPNDIATINYTKVGHYQDVNLTFGTVLAHEVGFHLIGDINDWLLTRPTNSSTGKPYSDASGDYADAPQPDPGGGRNFSKEACEGICDEMGLND